MRSYFAPVEEQLIAHGVDAAAASRLRTIDSYLVFEKEDRWRAEYFTSAARRFVSKHAGMRDRTVDFLVGGSANQSLHTVCRIVREGGRSIPIAGRLLVEDLIFMHGRPTEQMTNERAERLGVEPHKFDFGAHTRRVWAEAILGSASGYQAVHSEDAEWIAVCERLWGDDWIQAAADVLGINRRTLERAKRDGHLNPRLATELLALGADPTRGRQYGSVLRRIAKGESIESIGADLEAMKLALDQFRIHGADDVTT